MVKNEFSVKIYAPKIEARYRHDAIIESFDNLKTGEFLELSNDHDPKPLYYQFMIEKEDMFTWEYLQKGPLLWRVAIGKK